MNGANKTILINEDKAMSVRAFLIPNMKERKNKSSLAFVQLLGLAGRVGYKITE